MEPRPTQLEDLIGHGGIHPVTYPPPAYPYGVVTGQPYDLTENGKWKPYGEIPPVFLEGSSVN